MHPLESDYRRMLLEENLRREAELASPRAAQLRELVDSGWRSGDLRVLPANRPFRRRGIPLHI